MSAAIFSAIRFPLFTFHYGSTYITSKYFVSPVLADLHSTMVLLIYVDPALYGESLTFTFHYGSTYMKYPNSGFFAKSLFTFHYGSTYMGNRLGAIHDRIKFTFHYGSTYIFYLLFNP